ncbi:aldose epimerase family protein [Aliiruegeria sabulilitoris]|uniref:aldose epimerase family protein n=1 Tax=Aliiruegeria sabulilitoris TaxID=1510458 RepID=UPI00083409DE|nr:aldose epimerase family protein [Aliiruegeria sabulilitoris]NDR57017.1 galactose mutarotase [Pseudoruegeria sp. M32A2M]
MTVETFGQMPNGTPVGRYTISGGGLTARFLTFGAALQDLRLEGHAAPLVLGFEEFPAYLEHSKSFGITAGRYANRIRDGHVEIDGETYQLDTNFLGKHLLHGGAAGTGKRIWEVDHHGADSLALSIRLLDGEMGFPGNMVIHQTFTLLEGGVLDILLEAETDAPTLCNLAHHSYFNLGGENVADHLLQIDAETYLPVDEELIPTGERAPVEGTRFDFRHPAKIGPRSAQGLIDHNFCLSQERTTLRKVASLACPASGVSMELRTTEPGLQIFDGSPLNVPVPGLDGRRMGPGAGIAMEPQIWPDSPHNPDFAQAILRPGETYEQHTQYAFKKDAR